MSLDTKTYYEYILKTYGPVSYEDFRTDNLSICKDWDIIDFLSFTDNTGRSNLDYIFEYYPQNLKTEENIEKYFADKKLLIKLKEEKEAKQKAKVSNTTPIKDIQFEEGEFTAEDLGTGYNQQNNNIQKPLESLGKTIGLGQHYPSSSEKNTVGTFVKRIRRGTPEFNKLVRNTNQNIIFKREEGDDSDLYMTPKLKESLDKLAILVAQEWSGLKLRVTEAWDDSNIHTNNSYHYEGRAADLSTSDRDRSKYGRLARLAVDAGLDWVLHEFPNKNPNNIHVHVSVKIDNDKVKGEVAEKDNTIYDVIDEDIPSNIPNTTQFQLNLIYPLTRLSIDKEIITREILIGEGTQVDTLEYEAFLGNFLGLIKNDLYNPTSRSKLNFETGGITKKILPQITVWIWCRSLSDPRETNELSGTLLDVTSFVENVNTTVNGQIGSFNLSLAPIVCNMDDEGKWVLKNIKQVGDDGDFISKANLYRQNLNNNKKLEQFYFTNILTENDIVFIRFETLDAEVKERVKQGHKSKFGFEVDKNLISGNIYDMIGLIDIVPTGIGSTSNNVTINVQGRDLMKLFIEDGCYFYPMNYLPGGPFSTNLKTDKIQRIDGGAIYSLGLGINRTIDYTIKFVINAFSKIKICPTSLFDSYKTKRNQEIILVEGDTEKSKRIISDKKVKINELINDAKGYMINARDFELIDLSDNSFEIQKCYNILYDFLKYGYNLKERLDGKKISPLDVIDGGRLLIGWDSFNYEGELLFLNEFPNTVFNNLTIQESYRFGGTNLDLNKAAQIIFEIIKSEEVIQRYKGSKSVEDVEGIWQIIDIELDDEIANRRIVDSTIAVENGSLVNYIKKVCQYPFVEFYGDTYGDRYSLIARKPPFSYKKLQEWIEKGYIININESDVLDWNLQTNSGDTYSWYNIQAQDVDKIESHFYLKAVHFEEYMQIWGDKPLDIVSQYIPHFSNGNSKENLQINNIAKQHIYDLQYLVETNQMNPFVREGQISLAVGDRRIKRGTWIYFSPTDEYFYVESVTNDAQISRDSINRTTNITVQKGMVAKHLDKYFKIIDYPIDDKLFYQSQNYDEWIKSTTGKWQVNLPYFMFFLRRQQFELSSLSNVKDGLVSELDNLNIVAKR